MADPAKKNGLWAVLLATSFFAIVFWLVWFAGKVAEKVSDAYSAWQVRRATAAAKDAQPAQLDSGARASAAESAPTKASKAARDKKDE